MDKIYVVRARLYAASAHRGKLAEIALATKISSRTIYGLMHENRKPNRTTVDALLAYFKKEDRKAERAAK